jgi:hypothetical protein
MQPSRTLPRWRKKGWQLQRCWCPRRLGNVARPVSSKECRPPPKTCVPRSKKRKGHGPRQEQRGSGMFCLQPGMFIDFSFCNIPSV